MEIIIYSTKDEALDESSNLEEYRKTVDSSHLKWKAGAVPIAFHTRPLSYVERIRDKDRIISERARNILSPWNGFTLEHAYDVFVRNCVKITGGYALDSITPATVESMPGLVQSMVVEIGTLMITNATHLERTCLKN